MHLVLYGTLWYSAALCGHTDPAVTQYVPASSGPLFHPPRWPFRADHTTMANGYHPSLAMLCIQPQIGPSNAHLVVLETFCSLSAGRFSHGDTKRPLDSCPRWLFCACRPGLSHRHHFPHLTLRTPGTTSPISRASRVNLLICKQKSCRNTRIPAAALLYVNGYMSARMRITTMNSAIIWHT